MFDRGVIYYAAGDTYVQQALISAKSLKKHNEVRVTLYADQMVKSPHIDEVVQITPGDHPFYNRIDYFKQTPYDKTIHLDTDTYIIGDITPIFEMLGRFDIVAAYDEFRDTASEHTKFETVEINAPESFPEFQCGVIGYQNTDSIQDFFDDWQTRYKPYRGRNLLDQPHFREALYNNSVAVGTLPSEYNVRINFGGFLYDEAKVIHYAGVGNRPFIGTEIPGEEISEQIATTLNENTTESRTVIVEPSDGIRIQPTVEKSLKNRIRQSIQERGLIGTLVRAIEKAAGGDIQLLK